MTRSHLLVRVATFVALSAAAFAPVAGFAKDAAEAERKPIIDARADRVLRNMGEFLRDAEQFSLRADVRFDQVLGSGQKVQVSAVQDIAVRRPDRVFVAYEDDLGARRLWYDGKRISMYDIGEHVQASEAMPSKIDATLERLLKVHDFSPPLADLIYSDPYAILSQHAIFGAYLGTSAIDGVRCHHLAFVDASIDWQIWVEDGTQIVPRRFVITYKNRPGSPQFEADLSEWNFSERLPDVLFDPMIPADAVKVDLSTAAPESEKTK